VAEHHERTNLPAGVVADALVRLHDLLGALTPEQASMLGVLLERLAFGNRPPHILSGVGARDAGSPLSAL
jgi:hypothetical protein